MNRRGVTFVELMIVVTILGILANVAIPKVQDVRRRAEAASVIADFHAVRAAAFDRFAEAETFPSSKGWGQVPAELVASLPQGFTFQLPNVTYRWRRWSLPNGLPRRQRQSLLLGLQVRTDDPRLMESIKGLYGGPLAFGSATQVTLVIE